MKKYFKTPPKPQAFTLVEILVGALISAVLVIGIFFFAKRLMSQSKAGFDVSTLETELSRFQTLMITDLERAGNDSTGGSTNPLEGLLVYRVRTGACTKDKFYYGLVKDPSSSGCATKIGDLGIVSYQGVDMDRNGQFFPEEGVDFTAYTLRPPSPTGVTPAPPATPPPNFYNDYIVYAFDANANTITRKNLGNPDSATGDFSEVVLQNVTSFSVTFNDGPVPAVTPTPAAGLYYNRVTVNVMIHAPAPENGYANPALASSSPFYRHRTAARTFAFDVMTTAVSVN